MLALSLVVAAQMALVDSRSPAVALGELIARAAERNRRVPAPLRSYEARVESEIAVMMRRGDGVEQSLSLEQSQNIVRWQRDGEYRQHLTAYRGRNAGISLSALAVLTRAWTIPVLYGNRLSLLFGLDSSATAARDGGSPRAGEKGTFAVHPFADGRDSVYEFGGGDTVAIIRSGDRSIPIARVLVEPRRDQQQWPVIVFRGEIDLDASRGDIVRMRGSFLTLGRSGPRRDRLGLVPLDIVAFVELEFVEINGRWWLPKYQRIEAQVAVPALNRAGSAFRIVSRFRDHTVQESEYHALEAGGRVALEDDLAPERPAGDSIALLPHRLSLASRDTLSRRVEWWLPLGAATAGLHADDFLDIAPAAWRSGGAPAISLRARRFSDYVRFNRIEGWSTGLAAELRLRDAAPGVAIRAQSGWAWGEQTWRGRVEAESRRESWTAMLGAARALEMTNDFGSPLDSGGTLLAAIATVDDYDYVDRYRATLSFTRRLAGALSIRAEAGMARDGAATTHLTRGILRGDSLFRPNRGITEGRYARSAAAVELNPDLSADVVRQGSGVRVTYERGDGSLRWQRAELRLTTRRAAGPFALALRFDAGMLWSAAPPPQQLFELGRGQGLAGYGYKEFAGDRAALLRGLGTYRLPLGGAPLRVFGCACLTAPAPALAIGLQTGVVTASSAAARQAIARLGSSGDGTSLAMTPVARPSDGARSSVELGLRFFGGGVGVGFARPVSHAAPWRLLLTLARGI
jgi:hypothetical protein